MSDSFVKSYEFHGVDFLDPSIQSGEARATCPWCFHESQKFFVNTESGQFHCKHCDASGNLTTFLQSFFDEHDTTTADYKSLEANRPGIPWRLFKSAGLVIDRDTFASPRWLIPCRSTADSLQNVRVYVPGPDQQSSPILGTTGLPQVLWGLDDLKASGPVYVCEGEWDRLAFLRLIRAANKRASVLSVPGAQIFKSAWETYFRNRDVILLYDNDGPGERGMEKAISTLSGVAASIRSIEWPDDYPEKWDIRDQIQWLLDEENLTPAQAWQHMEELTTAAHTSSTTVAVTELDPPLPYPDLIKQLDNIWHLTNRTEVGLAVMAATIISIQLPGDPVWMFIVGPPGCGKTLFLKSFRLANYTIFKSSLTPKSLISGFMTETGEDPSLLAQLAGQCLILKDYTEIIEMGNEAQEEIYAILRGAFDGFAEKTFGNGITRSYPDCYFSLLAGVTNEIHARNKASLGERFLKYQFASTLEEDFDPADHIRAAIRSIKTERENSELAANINSSFVSRDIANDPSIKIPPIPKWVEDRVIALTQIIGALRATVARRGDEVLTRPSAEITSRLSKQLCKLAQCLAIVYGERSITKRTYAVVEQVAFDTAYGWNLDLFATIVRNPRPLLKETLDTLANISATTSHRRLEDMRMLNIVERVPLSDTGLVGKPAYGYSITPKFKRLWKQAKIDTP